MKIITAEFITGAVSAKQYPPGGLPEFAFAGRSNVGKSSLINGLLNRKKLVKTSSTPGKTQMINFFRINDQWVFADLPGYGYAKVPASVQKQWQKLIENYLLNRRVLKSVIFIVDIRRDPTPLDQQLQAWLEGYNIDYILVATKSDKVTKKERKEKLRRIQETYFAERSGEVIVFSSKSNEGRKELWKSILSRVGGEPAEVT